MSQVALVDERFDPKPAPELVAISPRQLLQTLRRNWLLIACCGLLFGACAYAYTVAFVPKRYTTSAVVTLDLSRQAIPALQGATNGEALPDPMPQVRSEVQILTSRALVQQVADELNLDKDPEYNGALRPKSATERFKRSVAEMLPVGLLKPLASVGLLPDVTEPEKPVPESVIRDSVIGAIQHDLSIINDNRSLIINVQFTAKDPVTAAAVANAIVKHYVENKASGRATANLDANTELSQRVRDIRTEIETLEKRISDTREKYNLVQTRAGSVGQQQLEDLSAALTRAASDRAQAQANYDRAAALARGGGSMGDNGAVVGSGAMSMLRDRESAAERRVAQLSSTLGAGHPQLRAAQAELGSVRSALSSEAQRIVAGLGAQAGAAKAREDSLRQQLDAAQRSAGNLAAVQSELQQLERDADSRRSIYQTLLQGEAQTASRRVASEQTGVRVISEAVAPAFPGSPKPKMAALLGMASGFAFGGLLALGRGRRERGFAQSDDVALAVGIAPMATIPRGPDGTGLAARVVADPNGPEAEALRALRTRLRFSGRTTSPRTVLFVSSVAGEGAADMAAAFARVAAQDGVRVLLLEGDLRSPDLARSLGVAANDGMVQVLQGREHWQEQVMQDPATPLEHLLSDAPSAAANQLLDSMQLQNLVAEARDEYNLVVMSGQPVGSATESMVLANLVDTVVLVVGAKRGRRRAVQDAIGTLVAAARKQPVVAVNKAA